MAKKRKSPAKRRRAPLKEAVKTRSRRRRSVGRRKSGLSEMFNQGNVMEAGKSMLSGAAGGTISWGIDRMLAEDTSPAIKAAAHLGGALVVAGAFGMQKTAAAMVGCFVKDLLTQNITMNEDFEDAEYTDGNVLSEYPDALDEAGNPMFLAEDGNLYYPSQLMPPMEENYQLAANY